MFAFLLGFYDENPTIYLIVCSLVLLLWIYFMYIELCTLDACDQHRLDMNVQRQQKTETPTISSDLTCKEIEWIKGKSRIWYADLDLAQIYLSLTHSLSLSVFLYAYHFNANIPFSICTVPNECNRFSTNIATNVAEHFFTSTPLTWIGFANKPIQMRFQNTGYDGNGNSIHTQKKRFK